MRIAIISDIHSNLEALHTALKIIDKKNVDELVCLGDIVGYGANPNECAEIVRKRTPHVLLGNHDAAALDLSLTESFNRYARVAAEWTHETLTAENVNYLNNLPMTFVLDDLLFVHSSPYEPEEWHYILSPYDAKQNFLTFKQKICFVGHSHVPGVFCEDMKTQKIKKNLRYIINVGSVGQPRDGDWRLSFGIFDTKIWSYEHIRAEYEVKTAAEKILKNGLPRFLAERLLVGM